MALCKHKDTTAFGRSTLIAALAVRVVDTVVPTTAGRAATKRDEQGVERPKKEERKEKKKETE